MKFAKLYAILDADGRLALAKKVGTDPGYLWQLATRWRDKRPSIEFMQKLVAADARLTIPEMVEEFSRAEPVKASKPPFRSKGVAASGGKVIAGKSSAVSRKAARKLAVAA